VEKIYRSVPGIGPISSRVLSNELGDLQRFSNERRLFSFTGLTPSEHSSGESVHKGHISRQGSSRIRKYLIEIAWRAIEKDPALKEIFERIAKTRGKKRAIVAIARKLIGRIRACFHQGSLYQLGVMA
jgi:transposase